jgi:CHAT domain-containing protein
VHVAAGMQVAGFRSVVATMWAIDDSSGPIMTEKVYDHLLRNASDGFDSTEAALTLNGAVETLRKNQYRPEQWVPFIHVGV